MRKEIWAVMVVGAEVDIIGYTISHLFAEGIDGIIVSHIQADDGTLEILESMARDNPRIILICDSDIAAFNGPKETRMMNTAREYGAEWVIPVDADELFVSTDPSRSLTQVIRDSGFRVIMVPVYNHYCTGKDVNDINPYKRMVWKNREPLGLTKVIVRADPNIVIDEGNHGAHSETGGGVGPGGVEAICMRHFSYRSEDIFLKKLYRNRASIAAADKRGCPDFYHTHWRHYNLFLDNHGEEGIRGLFREWMYFEDPEVRLRGYYMVYDPAPYNGDGYLQRAGNGGQKW